MSVEDKLDTIIENQEKILEKQAELKAEEDEVLQLEEKELEKDEHAQSTLLIPLKLYHRNPFPILFRF